MLEMHVALSSAASDMYARHDLVIKSVYFWLKDANPVEYVL